MMMKRMLAVSLLAGAAVWLAGCYDEPGATVYEPGVYKGDHDPLLDKVRTQAHQEGLRERFRTVQLDR
jgi:hypothetical protein